MTEESSQLTKTPTVETSAPPFIYQTVARLNLAAVASSGGDGAASADGTEPTDQGAPAPDGRGQILIDGSHRAALRIQTGLPVDAYLLTERESSMAIAITPLTMLAVHRTLKERGLLPDEH